jgi:hypothetical protein
MRTKKMFRARLGLALFATATIALTGCDGTATDPSGNTAPELTAGNSPAAASVRAPAATEARAAAPSHQAVTEIEAPASTKVHQPISEEDAATLLARVERTRKPDAQSEAAKTEAAQICIPCVFAPDPDLTVVEDDRDQWLWDPNGRIWYQGYARGFDIKNIGAGNAGTFHVAVLQGHDSYGFDVPGLAAGASEYFQITQPSYLGPACGVNAVIIVNPFNKIPESNYNNNVTTVAGICLL